MPRLLFIFFPTFVCWSSLHTLRIDKFLKPHQSKAFPTMTCNQRQLVSMLQPTRPSYLVVESSTRLNFLFRDNNDSLQEKNEDKIDGKDKWVKRWKHFQFPIGVPDNDLGQVGLWREVLSFPVPNYLTSYPFSFIRACVCMNCLSSLLLSV